MKSMDIKKAIKLDMASLQSEGPLLRQKILRPGDVLLVRGNTPFSSLIVEATKGEYSHAAIWIPGGDEKIDAIFLAESDTSGVGFTFQMPMYVYSGNSSQSEMVYKIHGNPKKWILLRHPDCKNINSADMHQASLSLQQEDFYKSYTALPRLLDTVVLPKSYHSAARLAAHAIESFRRKKGTRGVFCSELVANFFSKLGLELFSDGRAPHTVSPNDLLLPECRLRIVDDAFLDTKNLPSEAYAYGYTSQKRKDDPFLRGMINQRSINDRTTKSLNELQESLLSSTRAMSERFNQTSAEYGKFIEERIERAKRWNEPEQVERLQRYAAMYKYGCFIMKFTDEQDELQRFGERPTKNINSWNAAMAVLLYTASEILSHVRIALLRNDFLTSVRRIRKKYKNSSPSKVELFKFRRVRIKWLKDWEKQKVDNSNMLKLQKSSLTVGAYYLYTDIYINAVLQLAFEALTQDLASSQTEKL